MSKRRELPSQGIEGRYAERVAPVDPHVESALFNSLFRTKTGGSEIGRSLGLNTIHLQMRGRAAVIAESEAQTIMQRMYVPKIEAAAKPHEPSELVIIAGVPHLKGNKLEIDMQDVDGLPTDKFRVGEVDDATRLLLTGYENMPIGVALRVNELVSKPGKGRKTYEAELYPYMAEPLRNTSLQVASFLPQDVEYGTEGEMLYVPEGARFGIEGQVLSITESEHGGDVRTYLIDTSPNQDESELLKLNSTQFQGLHFRSGGMPRVEGEPVAIR